MIKAFQLLYLTLVLSAMSVDASQDSQPRIELSNIVRSYSDKQEFGYTAGIFLEPTKGEIYLADTGNHQIGIFNLEGATLWKFKHWVLDPQNGEKIPGDPNSVAVNKQGEIIVSDSRTDYLDVLDFRGNVLRKIDPIDYYSSMSFRAAALAFDEQGNLYIGIKGKGPRVLKLDPDYRLLLQFGNIGDGPNEFKDISAIGTDSEDRILVTDIFSIPVVKIFDAQGVYIGGFGGHEEGKTDFSFPAGVATTRGGMIWIVDTIRQVVKCLTGSGEYITMIGGFGNAPGEMQYPSAISSDGDSILVVAERNGSRFQQFIVK